MESSRGWMVLESSSASRLQEWNRKVSYLSTEWKASYLSPSSEKKTMRPDTCPRGELPVHTVKGELPVPQQWYVSHLSPDSERWDTCPRGELPVHIVKGELPVPQQWKVSYLSPADSTVKRLPAVVVDSTNDGAVTQEEFQHLQVTIARSYMHLTSHINVINQPCNLTIALT